MSDVVHGRLPRSVCGHGGVRQVDVTGLVAATFVHRDSRAGDPNLHTHVAIANNVQTLDGKWLFWNDHANDPWPWLAYFSKLLARGYARFAEGVATDRSGGTKSERVREHVLRHGAPVFAISEVRAALPGISDPTIRLVLNELKDDGLLKPQGTGRSAVWLRVTT